MAIEECFGGKGEGEGVERHVFTIAAVAVPVLLAGLTYTLLTRRR